VSHHLRTGLKVTCALPDHYLRTAHGVVAGVTTGTLVRSTRLSPDDRGWLVDWGDGAPVRCDPRELAVAEDHPANQDPALPSVVLDVFAEEMERRAWSTSAADIAAARTATLERFRRGA
jgi:hypothetical protein